MIAILLLPLFGAPAGASSAPATYELPWLQASERLTYRSCGCADSCWTAELRERRSKRLKARLRCDCERLLVVYPARSPERTLGESCAAINDAPDKNDAISGTVKALVDGKQ